MSFLDAVAQPFTTPVPTPMINLGVLQQPWLRALATDEAAPAMELLNRNARRPKKVGKARTGSCKEECCLTSTPGWDDTQANHGKRPCSHHRRRQKRLSRRSA
jgi:hypothetical protein